MDKTSHTIMVCCVLHNFCELHKILEPIVHDIKEQGDPLMDFGKIYYYQEG
jgi:hypothetical protein